MSSNSRAREGWKKVSSDLIAKTKVSRKDCLGYILGIPAEAVGRDHPTRVAEPLPVVRGVGEQREMEMEGGREVVS